MTQPDRAAYDAMIELGALAWLASHREAKFREQVFRSVLDGVALLDGVVGDKYDAQVVRKVMEDIVTRANELFLADLRPALAGQIPADIAAQVEQQFDGAMRKTLAEIGQRFPVRH
jgi:ribosomal protein L17